MWLVFYSMVWAASPTPLPWGQIWMGKANCQTMRDYLKLQHGRFGQHRQSLAECIRRPLFIKLPYCELRQCDKEGNPL